MLVRVGRFSVMVLTVALLGWPAAMVNAADDTTQRFADCNHNSIPDDVEIAAGSSPDCDSNGIPDACDVRLSFESVIIQWEGPEISDIDAVDLDMDGDVDVLAASDSTGWYENLDREATMFAYHPIIDQPAWRVESVDMDRDGDPDVVAVLTPHSDQWPYIAYMMVWFENLDGGGSLGNANLIVDMGHLWAYYDIADLDADNDPDVVAVSPLTKRMGWYEHTDGQGSFSSFQEISSDGGQGIYAISIADLDGDDDGDVITAGSSIGWYENLGNGAFGTENTVVAAMQRATSVDTADFDGDGSLDIVVAVNEMDQILWFANSNGLGDFGSEQVVTNAVPYPFTVVAADFDGDGDADVVSGSLQADEPSMAHASAWYENLDGAGAFSPPEALPVLRSGVASLQVVDMNADGHLDVVAADFVGGQIAWHRTISSDCDLNGVLDACELEGNDCNTNGTLDICELPLHDCNANLLIDSCEVADGSATDCNTNMIPDECEPDCNQNNIADDCEADFDGDGLIDPCDPDIDDDGVDNAFDLCDDTPPGTAVSPWGAPKGDMDNDCTPTVADHLFFESCLTQSGPGRQPVAEDCHRAFDFDDDFDVDLRDFALFAHAIGNE